MEGFDESWYVIRTEYIQYGQFSRSQNRGKLCVVGGLAAVLQSARATVMRSVLILFFIDVPVGRK